MPDNRPVVVDVDLKPNDVYTPFQWNWPNVARWVVSIVLCMIFYDLYQHSRATILSFPDGESIEAVVGLLVLFILFALLLFPYLRIRAMFRRSPILKRTRRYTFEAARITTQSDDANSDCKWSLFQRVVETPSAFVFSLTSQGGMYVPKRCFSSSEEVHRLRTLIRENMPGKSRLRPD
ncbi:MAG: YcxB family protein [Candidatus Acidiferrales bacterium]